MEPFTIADLPKSEKEKVSRLVQKLISLGREHELALNALSQQESIQRSLNHNNYQSHKAAVDTSTAIEISQANFRSKERELSEARSQYVLACGLLEAYQAKLKDTFDAYSYSNLQQQEQQIENRQLRQDLVAVQSLLETQKVKFRAGEEALTALRNLHKEENLHRLEENTQLRKQLSESETESTLLRRQIQELRDAAEKQRTGNSEDEFFFRSSNTTGGYRKERISGDDITDSSEPAQQPAVLEADAAVVPTTSGLLKMLQRKKKDSVSELNETATLEAHRTQEALSVTASVDSTCSPIDWSSTGHDSVQRANSGANRFDANDKASATIFEQQPRGSALLQPTIHIMPRPAVAAAAGNDSDSDTLSAAAAAVVGRLEKANRHSVGQLTQSVDSGVHSHGSSSTVSSARSNDQLQQQQPRQQQQQQQKQQQKGTVKQRLKSTNKLPAQLSSSSGTKKRSAAQKTKAARGAEAVSAAAASTVASSSSNRNAGSERMPYSRFALVRSKEKDGNDRSSSAQMHVRPRQAQLPPAAAIVIPMQRRVTTASATAPAASAIYSQKALAQPPLQYEASLFDLLDEIDPAA